MILITSTGEFILYFTVSLFLVSFHYKKKKRFAAGLFFCVVLSCPISTVGCIFQWVWIVSKWNSHMKSNTVKKQTLVQICP